MVRRLHGKDGSGYVFLMQSVNECADIGTLTRMLADVRDFIESNHG